MERNLLWAGAAASTAAVAAGIALAAAGRCVVADGSGAAPADGRSLAAMRRLRLGELKARAERSGVAQATILAALDVDDPKEALVALVASAVGKEGTAARNELRALSMGALHRRATTEGVDQEVLERALNSDDPKAALVDSIIDITAGRGLDDDTMLAVLVSGSGDAAAETLAAALEQAVGVLEQLSISSPRKSRKLLLEAMDRIETTLEVVAVTV